MKNKRLISDILVHAFLAVLAIVWLFPVYWVILTSFRKEKGAYPSSFFPKEYTLDNYKKLLNDVTVMNFPKMFWNTFIIAVFSCLVTTFFVLSVAYALSRLRFKMRKKYMNIALILGMFPGFMSMIALYYILKIFGLTEGSLIKVALVLAYSGASGLGFYISKGFFDTIPKALDEAAYIDGATKWQVFSRITIPLSKPIVVYTIMQAFLAPWLDFLLAKVIVRADADNFTVALGLWNMLDKEYIYNWYTCFAAGAVLVSIPIAVLFLNMQKYYAEGLSGAVKG